MDEQPEQPPHGFQVVEGEDGRWTVRYRAEDVQWRHVRLNVQMLGITAVVLITFISVAVFEAGGVVAYVLLVLTGLAFLFQLFMFVVVAWHLWSVTTFAFAPDELIVERSLWGYRYGRAFRRGDVRAVVQAKPAGQEQLPIAELALVGDTRETVLWQRPIGASDWLGPIIARWAGVPFEPWAPPVRRSIEPSG